MSFAVFLVLSGVLGMLVIGWFWLVSWLDQNYS